MPHDSELASSWVPKVMVGIFILAPVVLIAGCVAIYTTLVIGGIGTLEPRCRTDVTNAFTIEPPAFLLAEPCIFVDFVPYTSYGPATPDAPSLLIFPWLSSEVRNPIEWAPRTTDLNRYGATFECDGLPLQAIAHWDHTPTSSANYVPEQLRQLAAKLDEACAAFDYVPPPTREPRR